MIRSGGRLRRAPIVALGSALLLSLLASPGDATPLTPQPTLDLQSRGQSVAEGGVGLEALGMGSETISVTIGGPVDKAILYWAGRERADCRRGACFDPPNVAPFPDQQMIFEGTALLGDIAGREDDVHSAIGYKADVTGIVAAKGTGTHSFTIQDGDTADNLDLLSGAGLLVLYRDPTVTSVHRVMVADGLDFAWGNGTVPPYTADNLVTDPVTFEHGGSTSARSAQLVVFAGDTEASRPDRIDISNNPSLVDQLDGSDGPGWDTDSFTIDIPAGITTTTAQLFSTPADQHPDSLSWVMTSLRVPVDGPFKGCTPGYWKNHAESWLATGYVSSDPLESIFDMPDALGFDSTTLLQALKFGGGPGVVGGAKILLRAGVASLLNGSHPNVNFPMSDDAVISQVNAALAGNDRNAMTSLAATLDRENNLGCTLS